MHLEGTEHDQVGRLFDLAAVGVNVEHAGRARARGIEQDPGDVRVGTHLEVRPIPQDGQDGRLGRGLRIQEATEALAVAAQVARPHANAVGVRVGDRAVGSGHREGLVAQLRSGLLETPGALDRRHRGRWKLVAARPLEGVPSSAQRAAQVASDARDTTDLLEVIEVRLELVEGDRVVLDRHLGRDELFAVALLDMASQAQVLW